MVVGAATVLVIITHGGTVLISFAAVLRIAQNVALPGLRQQANDEQAKERKNPDVNAPSG